MENLAMSELNVTPPRLTCRSSSQMILRSSTKKAAPPAAAAQTSAAKKKTPSTSKRKYQQQTPRRIIEDEDESPSKKQQQQQTLHLDHITAEQINKTAVELFGGKEDDMLQRPCVSARLFACYVVKKQHTTSGHYSKAGINLQPILPFLKALVHVEVVSLGPSCTIETEELTQQQSSSSSDSISGVNADYATKDFVLANENRYSSFPAEKNQRNNNRSPNKPYRKKTHFSGFDCSSVRPPVDREIGLLVPQHQQDSIKALTDCKDELSKLTKAAITGLQDLVDFLAHGAAVASDKLAKECALAICKHYPPQRVHKVAAMYHNEFTILSRRLLKLPSSSTSSSSSDDVVLSPLQNTQAMMNYCCSSPHHRHPEPLLFEQKLAEQVGQAVRYILRVYFNRAPPRLSTVNEAYDQHAETAFSKVHACFSMVMADDNQNNEAVDDSFISALVSKALRCFYAFFGLNRLLDASATVPDIPKQFCASEASQRRLPIRSKKKTPPSVPSTKTSDADVEIVQHDIAQATDFLAATKAARFLLDLWTAPGVQDEIARMGGWAELEHYAAVSWKFDLWQLCEADAHLVVLCNYQAFLKRLDDYCSVMEESVCDCQAALERTKKNYHLTSKKLAVKFPEIEIFNSVYSDGMELATSFPLILPPQEDNDSDADE